MNVFSVNILGKGNFPRIQYVVRELHRSNVWGNLTSGEGETLKNFEVRKLWQYGSTEQQDV